MQSIEAVNQVVRSYGKTLEEIDPNKIYDAGSLPYDKLTILSMIGLKLAAENLDVESQEALGTAMVMLSQFQEDVGETPINELAVDAAVLDEIISDTGEIDTTRVEALALRLGESSNELTDHQKQIVEIAAEERRVLTRLVGQL